MIYTPYQKPPLGQQINWEHPLSRGIVGCWLMNEGSGNKIYDLSGNNRVGTFVGDTFFTPQSVGPALSMDGNSDYVTLPFSFAGATKFSWSYWMRRRAVNSLVYLGFGTLGTNQLIMGFYSDGYCYSTIARNDQYSTFTSNDALWHHVVMAYNGAGADNPGKMKIYLDSKPQTLTFTGTIDSAVSVDTTGFSIGYVQNGTRYTDGFFSNLLFYNRPINQAEVTELYYRPYAMFERRPIWSFYGEAAPATGNRRRRLLICGRAR